MNQEIKNLITLAASAVNQTSVEPALVSGLDLDALYNAAAFHQMAALVAAALEKAGVKDPRFSQARAKALRKSLIHDVERESILAELEEAQIWYMPLKGVILKDYYPALGMREMSDNDILFDASRAEDVKRIMESREFMTVHYGTGHQDDYQKAPVCHFEMHRMLFAPSAGERLYEYYKNISDKLIAGDGYARSFTQEDFYLYMVAHEYKHFYWNGTGLRSLLDIYVFLRRFEDKLDWTYVKAEIQKLGISDFEERNRALARKVFSGAPMEPLSAEQAEMLEYFASAGVYGTRERGIQNKVKEDGLFRYLYHRLFLPLNTVEEKYPFFYKHRILLPCLPIYRLLLHWKNVGKEIRSLFRKK